MARHGIWPSDGYASVGRGKRGHDARRADWVGWPRRVTTWRADWGRTWPRPGALPLDVVGRIANPAHRFRKQREGGSPLNVVGRIANPAHRFHLATLDGHADLLQQFLALVLKQVGQVRQPRRAGGGESFGDGRGPAGEGIQHREVAQAHGLEAGVAAAALGLLPQGLALAGQGQVVFRPQENEMIDHRRLGVEGGQLDAQVLRLGRAAPQEKTDADFPRLAVLARPVADADGAVGRMIAESTFAVDVLQPTGAVLQAVLVADLQKGAEPSLQFARGARQRPVELPIALCGLHLLLPTLDKLP